MRAEAQSVESGAQRTDAPYLSAGRPFFVMELVRGIKITDFCDENKLSTADRLKLFIQVCQAIQHAHQKGIIHRDIKPSNILVTVNDGVPVPKVIDFGIAKATAGRLTDQTLFTAFEQFIGTPAYMSPEQAVLTSLDIDTRSDIYSLGVLLYELLTGSPPFDQKQLLAAGLDEMRRTIREVEPAKPSTRLTRELVAADVSPLKSHPESARNVRADSRRLLQEVKGDLDWIVMKCLEKDRARRYETANGLAADIQRHQNCEPVIARPPSRLYEFQKSVRRHKFGFAAAGAVVVALAIGLGISTWQFVQKNRAYHRATQAEQEQTRQRRIAETKEKQSQQVAQFLKDMLASVEPSVALGRDTAMLREILDRTAQRVGKDLTNQTEVQAELLSTIGVTYFGLGDSQKAIAIHREALRLRRALFGETNVWVAASLNELGEALGMHQDFPEAEGVLRQALAIRRRLLGNNDSDTARSLTALAGVLLELPSDGRNHLPEADTLQREALAVQTNLFPGGHEDVFQSLNNLGIVVLAQNRLTEAEAIHHEALKLARKLHGAEHPNVATALSRLGRVLVRQNKRAEAEPWLRDGYLMRRKFLGNDHTYVSSSLDSYAGALNYQVKFAEAEAVLRENWAQRTTRPPQTLMHQMTTALFGQGEFIEAVELLREELALRKQLHGEESASTLECLRYLASARAKAGDPAGAESTYQDLLRSSRKQPGQEQFTAGVLGEWGRFLQSQRRYEEAVKVHREELELRKKMPGDNHQFVDSALGWLAQALQSAGKLAEVKALYREELDLARAADGKGLASANPRMGLLLHHFAEALWIQKAFKEARPPAEQAWTLFEQHPDWPENERSHANRVLHAVLTSLNDQLALELLSRKELENLRRKLPADDPEIAINLENLAAHLLAQQKFTEAEAAHHQALVMRQGLALKAGERSDAQALREAAWFLASCDEATFRDGSRAVELAEKAARATSRTNSLILDTLAAAYAETGEFAKAISIQKEAMGLLTNTNQMAAFSSRLELYLASQPYRQTSYKINIANWLATGVLSLLEQGMAAEAEQSVRACLRIREQMMPDDWRTFNSRSQLGGSLLGQKKYAEAEPFLLSGYEGMMQREQSIPDAGKVRIRETLQRLVKLYEATSRPEKAAEWNKKLAAFNQTEVRK